MVATSVRPEGYYGGGSSFSSSGPRPEGTTTTTGTTSTATTMKMSGDGTTMTMKQQHHHQQSGNNYSPIDTMTAASFGSNGHHGEHLLEQELSEMRKAFEDYIATSQDLEVGLDYELQDMRKFYYNMMLMHKQGNYNNHTNLHTILTLNNCSY